jgi:hypothetical protein
MVEETGVPGGNHHICVLFVYSFVKFSLFLFDCLFQIIDRNEKLAELFDGKGMLFR